MLSIFTFRIAGELVVSYFKTVPSKHPFISILSFCAITARIPPDHDKVVSVTSKSNVLPIKDGVIYNGVVDDVKYLSPL